MSSFLMLKIWFNESAHQDKENSGLFFSFFNSISMEMKSTCKSTDHQGWVGEQDPALLQDALQLISGGTECGLL